VTCSDCADSFCAAGSFCAAIPENLSDPAPNNKNVNPIEMRETRINFIIFFTPWVGMDTPEVGRGA
jgi:hypothetical protein